MRAHASTVWTAEPALLQRSCSCGGTCESCQEKDRNKQLRRAPAPGTARHGHDFSRVPSHQSRTTLRLGPAGDAFEREADRIADSVMAGGIMAPQRAAVAHVQRKIDEGLGVGEADDETAPAGTGVEGTAEDSDALAAADEDEDVDEGEEEEEGDYDDPTGQPKLADGAAHSAGRVRLPLGSGAGTSLAPSLRSSMEDRIGHNFTSVRVHTDNDAARSAEAIHARAFTVGSDIYFAAGSYQPSSPSGQHLIAHELTHVVQQSAGRPAGTVQLQPQRRRRRLPTPPPSSSPPRRRRATTPSARFCTVHGRRGKKPCGPSTCDGNCSRGSNPFTHNPCCGNETCGPSAAVDSSFFIRHLDVNLATQQTTAEWGTRTQTLDVATFLTSPNPRKTPPGRHTIGDKCGPCHTNGDGEGMAWLAGFVGIRFGFHDSQLVARGTRSHGCVRLDGCACAKEVHDNTWSGVTSVCVHSGRHCGRPQPRAGAADPAHHSVCGTLRLALPPAPAPPQRPGRPARRRRTPSGSPQVPSVPGRAPRTPNASADEMREVDAVAENDFEREDEEVAG